MVKVQEELKEYFYEYYSYNKQFDIPKNINVMLLEEDDFYNAVKNKSREVFGIKHPDLSDSLNGLIIVDSKNKYRNTYNIYILKKYEEVYPYIVNILFHELSHAHTLPDIEIIDLKNFDEENNGHSLIGYNFWREFIANYLGNKTFINTCGCINYIDSKSSLIKLTIDKINELKEKESSIDELISFIVLTENDILKDVEFLISKKDFESFKKIINLCENLIKDNDENYKISIEDYDKLGSLICNIKNS